MQHPREANLSLCAFPYIPSPVGYDEDAKACLYLHKMHNVKHSLFFLGRHPILMGAGSHRVYEVPGESKPFVGLVVQVHELSRAA